jgi:N-acetyl-anhydromuramyl-L-alanine amidase AmpD
VGVHWTGTRSASHSWIAAWSQKKSVSTHLEIDWDGVVYQWMDLKWRAYHYGIGWFNDRSVGLDLTNPVGYNKVELWNRRLVELGQVERPVVRGYRFNGWRPKPFLGATPAQIESLHAVMVCLYQHLGIPMVAPADIPGQPKVLRRLEDVKRNREASRKRMPPGWYHHCQGRNNRFDHLGLELTTELNKAKGALCA